MTVSTTSNKVRINGNGETTSFQFSFPLLKNDFSDLIVYRIDIDEETEEETSILLTITTNYTVVVNKNLEQRITSGTVNLIDESGDPLALTTQQALFIQRIEAITQDLDLQENQKFPYKNLENALDKQTIIAQQQQEQIERAIKFSAMFSGLVSGTMENPESNKCLVWKQNLDNSFYLGNSENNPDEVYQNIVENENVINVGQNINNVNITANNIDNVNNVSDSINNINTVATNINNVNLTSTNILNVNTVATNITNINTVEDNILNVNTVAEDIDNINEVAENIADIKLKANTDLDNITQTAKTTISNLPMPSNRYIDITYTSAGSYTAPANGWFTVSVGNTSNKNAVLFNATKGIYINGYQDSGSGVSGCIIPAAEGDLINYAVSRGTPYYLRFIYAEGDE